MLIKLRWRRTLLKWNLWVLITTERFAFDIHSVILPVKELIRCYSEALNSYWLTLYLFGDQMLIKL
jgi:hypothetical protein